MRHRPVCVGCETEFVLKEAVVRIVDMEDIPAFGPGQKIWLGDKYVCPKCEAVIVVNLAEKAVGRAGMGVYPLVQEMVRQRYDVVLNYPLKKLTEE